MTARVLIRLKPGILDVQGVSVQRALGGLGFPEVRGVRVGKVIELELDRFLGRAGDHSLETELFDRRLDCELRVGDAGEPFAADLGERRDEPGALGDELFRRLADAVDLPARELVSTFGHGRHSCPAQRFSISAIRIAIRRLLERYDLTPRFRTARPLARP